MSHKNIAIALNQDLLQVFGLEGKRISALNLRMRPGQLPTLIVAMHVTGVPIVQRFKVVAIEPNQGKENEHF